MKTRTTLFLGALLMAIAVALGAFGSHALKGPLESTGRFGTYEVAVRYMLIHALALLVLGALMEKRPKLAVAAALIFGGMVFFSGSLLLLAITNNGMWGPVTPIGGTLLIAGWLAAAWAVLRR